MFFFQKKIDTFKNKKTAFTISEVLVALGIMGVIAALTIPSLMQVIENRDLVSRLIKIQNTLSNGYQNAFPVGGQVKISDMENLEDVIAIFESAFTGVSHDCINDTCLQDGAEISYSDFLSECSLNVPGSATALRNSCMSIAVDVNGVKKRPNKAGRDRFRFWVTQDGVFPEGSIDSCANGYDCTAYVLLFKSFYDYGNVFSSGCVDENCSVCQDGYYKENNVCVKQHLANCLSYSGATCASCDEGFKILNGICVEE